MSAVSLSNSGNAADKAAPVVIPTITSRMAEGYDYDAARDRRKVVDRRFNEWKAKKDEDEAAARAKQQAERRRYKEQVAKIETTRNDTAFDAWVERKKREAQKAAEGPKCRKSSSFTGKVTVDEFVAAFRRNQFDPPELLPLFEDLLNRLDYGNKGRVNRSEFAELLEQVNAQSLPVAAPLAIRMHIQYTHGWNSMVCVIAVLSQQQQ